MRIPYVVLGLVVVSAAGALGYSIGAAAAPDSTDADRAGRAAVTRSSVAAERTAYKTSHKRARSQGLAAGSNRARAPGEMRGRETAAENIASLAPPVAPAGQPPQTPEPRINMNCPAGQEPTATGGCEPYDETDGQMEPKINDPRCYKADYPPECF